MTAALPVWLHISQDAKGTSERRSVPSKQRLFEKGEAEAAGGTRRSARVSIACKFGSQEIRKQASPSIALSFMASWLPNSKHDAHKASARTPETFAGTPHSSSGIPKPPARMWKTAARKRRTGGGMPQTGDSLRKTAARTRNSGGGKSKTGARIRKAGASFGHSGGSFFNTFEAKMDANEGLRLKTLIFLQSSDPPE